MQKRFFLSALLVLAAAPALAKAPRGIRVELKTSEGAIVVELATKQAPITAANFLKYAEQNRFDDTNFYRASRSKRGDGTGFIQGGIRRSYRRMLIPIKHEPTNVTGLKHIDGTISMARDAPGTAMGDFFITVGPMAYMDAQPGKPGYAAFGHVVSGMPVVKKILAAHTVPNAGGEGMKGQLIDKPVKIISARRLP